MMDLKIKALFENYLGYLMSEDDYEVVRFDGTTFYNANEDNKEYLVLADDETDEFIELYNYCTRETVEDENGNNISFNVYEYIEK